MRVEEVVGLRLREERERAGLSQAQLGQYVAPLLGRVWPRQAISHAEAGRRAFTAAELIAFAHVVGCEPGRLLIPPHNVDKVTMPSGESLKRDQLVAPANNPEVDELRGRIARLIDHGLTTEREGREVVAHARKLYDAVDDGVMAHAIGRAKSRGTANAELIRGEGNR